MEMFNPPHLGEILREDCLKPLGLTVTAAAKGLGVSRGSLSELLNGRNGVSAEMAIRLEKAGRGPPIHGCLINCPTISGMRADAPKQSKSSVFLCPKQRIRRKQPLPLTPHLKITDMGLVDVYRFEFVRGQLASRDLGRVRRDARSCANARWPPGSSSQRSSHEFRCVPRARPARAPFPKRRPAGRASPSR
jgi:addiction module HigA family antidote